MRTSFQILRFWPTDFCLHRSKNLGDAKMKQSERQQLSHSGYFEPDSVWTEAGPEWLFWISLGIHNCEVIKNHQFSRKTATIIVIFFPRENDLKCWSRKEPESLETVNGGQTQLKIRNPDCRKSRKIDTQWHISSSRGTDRESVSQSQRILLQKVNSTLKRSEVCL